jgi:hypothetical protein
MVIEADETDLPQHLLEEIAKQPAKIDRVAGAALITALLFPVSAKTVKAWPLDWSCPNGRAIAPTEAYVKYAYRKARHARATTNRWRHLTNKQADAA